jgi:competence protein ComFC
MGNGIVKRIKYILDCVLNVIYDGSGNCVICGEPIDEEYICTKCHNKIVDREMLHFINKGDLQIQCISAGYYSGIMKELILKLKYKSDFRCGSILADILHGIIIKNSIEYDYVAYIPSSKSALKNRGYNQAEYMAKLIANKGNKKLLHCFSKDKKAKDQIGLDGKDRWRNLKDSFSFIEKNLIENSSILIIDDVITTGATAFYCSELLIKNRCKKVMVLTVAKSKL